MRWSFSSFLLYVGREDHLANRERHVEDAVQLTNVQTFDWGFIRWTIEPDDLESQWLSVAEIIFYPGKTQAKHMHYREEQMLHVLDGTGLHIVNGSLTRLRPGDSVVVPPYAEHEVTNDSAKDLRLLLVYSPSRFHPLLRGHLEKKTPDAMPDSPEESAALSDDAPFSRPLEPLENPQGFFDDDAKNVILVAMERLSKALGLSLSMVGTEGLRILRTENHPALCSVLADQTAGEHCRFHLEKVFQSLSGLPREELNKPRVIACCHSIASTIFPILIEGRVQAYMKCGEIFLGEDEKKALLARAADIADGYGMPRELVRDAVKAVPVEPKSRLYAAAEASFAMTTAVASMAAAAQRQKELDMSRLSLAREHLATERLEKALREADLKLLQSQVTPHFLFNTLNTIALAAYAEDAGRAAELTWSLSDLLRATLRKTEELIPLREEINLLQSYIHIQQERFGDRIAFVVDVEEACLDTAVPSLLFQPLVENAIIHGFGDIACSGTISLAIARSGSGIRAVLQDDGAGYVPRPLETNPKKIGLQSVRARLEHYYGNAGTMHIASKPGKGTRIAIMMPLLGGMESPE